MLGEACEYIWCKCNTINPSRKSTPIPRLGKQGYIYRLEKSYRISYLCIGWHIYIHKTAQRTKLILVKTNKSCNQKLFNSNYWFIGNFKSVW